MERWNYYLVAAKTLITLRPGHRPRFIRTVNGATDLPEAFPFDRTYAQRPISWLIEIRSLIDNRPGFYFQSYARAIRWYVGGHYFVIYVGVICSGIRRDMNGRTLKSVALFAGGCERDFPSMGQPPLNRSLLVFFGLFLDISPRD